MGFFSCLSPTKAAPEVVWLDKSSVAIATDMPRLMDQGTQTEDAFVQEVCAHACAFEQPSDIFSGNSEPFCPCESFAKVILGILWQFIIAATMCRVRCAALCAFTIGIVNRSCPIDRNISASIAHTGSMQTSPTRIFSVYFNFPGVNGPWGLYAAHSSCCEPCRATGL